MTTLQQRLDRIREGFEARAPAETLAIMHRVRDELVASGMVDRLPKVGERLPDFELRNSAGTSVSSQNLLSKGPLVLTFYRGRW